MRLYRQSVKASFRYACQSAVVGRYNEIKASVVLWRHLLRITIVSVAVVCWRQKLAATCRARRHISPQTSH